jgi:hypothetical protein
MERHLRHAQRILKIAVIQRAGAFATTLTITECPKAKNSCGTLRRNFFSDIRSARQLLMLSTPITVCLLVAGRHMKGLGVLELLLGNATPRSVPQKSHKQAPRSGDPHEIIGDAPVSGQEGIALV